MNPEPKKFTEAELFIATQRLFKLNEIVRNELASILEPFAPVLAGLASRFDEQGLRYLMEGHIRIPQADIKQIDPSAPYPVDDDDQEAFIPPTLYCRILSLQLTTSEMLDRDGWFPVPHNEDEARATNKVSFDVGTLSPEESVALQVLFEAARAVPRSTIKHDNWWHPDVMLRLLRQPE